ncbi:hypothetical protein JCM8547_005900 [Rhodosporidiobolus lusitaniae]
MAEAAATELPNGLSLEAAELYRRYHTWRLQSATVTLMAMGILYGLILPQAVRYLRLFWRSDVRRGTTRDSAVLRWMVVAMAVFSAAYIGVCVADSWQEATLSIERAGYYAPSRNALLVAEFVCVWVLSAVCEAFWGWRAIQVGNHIAIKILVPLLYLGNVSTLLTNAIYVGLATSGANITFRTISLWSTSSLWIGLAFTFLCAGVLVYQLGWKRRNNLVRSSGISGLLELAVRTSALIAAVYLGGAIACTVAYADRNFLATVPFDALGRIYSLLSVLCVIYALNARHAHRSALPTSSIGLDGSTNQPSFPLGLVSLGTALGGPFAVGGGHRGGERARGSWHGDVELAGHPGEGKAGQLAAAEKRASVTERGKVTEQTSKEHIENDAAW